MESPKTVLELSDAQQQIRRPDAEDVSYVSGEANWASSLPPTDTGKDAWLFLFASFMLEALIWGKPNPLACLSSAELKLILSGFPACFGVFQEYYSSHEPFAGSPNIAVVGACAMVSLWLFTSELATHLS